MSLLACFLVAGCSSGGHDLTSRVADGAAGDSDIARSDSGSAVAEASDLADGPEEGALAVFSPPGAPTAGDGASPTESGTLPNDAAAVSGIDGSRPGDAGGGATYVTCQPGQPHAHNANNDNWAGTLTLFISYSADTRSQTVDKGYTPEAWNAAVNSFDVTSFADQVANTGAKNILLMLGQNTGFYCAPNSVYEGYAGVAPGTRCSKRDLPMEIADALLPKGIGLYLYLPEDVGWGDTAAANHFGLTSLAVANWVVDASFTPKWNAVIKAWADRYGSKVKGWFFDGYESRWGVTANMAQTYRGTCLNANPCGVVTFNGSNSGSVSDTERGETRIDPSTGFPAKGLPTSRWNRSGLQVMWDFPLQAAWGQEIADNSPPIYTNANLKTFVTAAIKAQAVFALDCKTSLAGALSTPVYNQLVAIRQ